MRLISRWHFRNFNSRCAQILSTQDKLFRYLLRRTCQTEFGRDHKIESNLSMAEFQRKIPIRDYSELAPYIDRISSSNNPLAPEAPAYFAITSGTTGGPKTIPISSDHLKYYLRSGSSLVLNYIGLTGDTEILSGSKLYLQGSPDFEMVRGVYSGRLSGIVEHHIPGWFRSSKLPSYQTNRVKDWDRKTEAIIAESRKMNLRLIAGVPPWVLGFLRKAPDLSQNIRYYIQGGADFRFYEPYFDEIFKNRPFVRLESFACSEGFLGLRFAPEAKHFRLNPEAGIFYQFIEVEDYLSKDPVRRLKRKTLHNLNTNVDYLLIIHSLSGLMGYINGDVVRFSSKAPFEFSFVRRLNEVLSVFGEHVTQTELEESVKIAARRCQVKISDFFVDVVPPYKWHLAIASPHIGEENRRKISQAILLALSELNNYFKHSIENKLQPEPTFKFYDPDQFNDELKRRGRYGGQNKISRYQYL